MDSGDKFIAYIYNALGQKVAKQVIHQSATELVNSNTDYLGGYQYLKGVLQYFPTSEGYVNVTSGNAFDYVCNYTDHLGNIRLSYSKPNGGTIATLEENHYYPFGMKHMNYGSERNNYERDESGGTYAVLRPVDRNKYQYKFQGQERQDELLLNWDSFKWRNYDYAIGRFMSIDPLAEQYAYQSPYNFAENKVIDHRELEGLEGVWFGTLWGTNNTPPATTTMMNTAKATVEFGAKASEVMEGSTTAATRLAQNGSRGRATEAEQLLKNGYEKNTESFTRVDPKSGKETTTIPDAIRKDGGTVEIKDVGKQSFTRQLRTQKEISTERGVKPELIINESAKISKPLQNGGFDIKTYNKAPVLAPAAIDNLNVPKPELPRRIEAAPKSRSADENRYFS